MSIWASGAMDVATGALAGLIVQAIGQRMGAGDGDVQVGNHIINGDHYGDNISITQHIKVKLSASSAPAHRAAVASAPAQAAPSGAGDDDSGKMMALLLVVGAAVTIYSHHQGQILEILYLAGMVVIGFFVGSLAYVFARRASATLGMVICCVLCVASCAAFAADLNFLRHPAFGTATDLTALELIRRVGVIQVLLSPQGERPLVFVALQLAGLIFTLFSLLAIVQFGGRTIAHAQILVAFRNGRDARWAEWVVDHLASYRRLAIMGTVFSLLALGLTSGAFFVGGQRLQRDLNDASLRLVATASPVRGAQEKYRVCVAATSRITSVVGHSVDLEVKSNAGPWASSSQTGQVIPASGQLCSEQVVSGRRTFRWSSGIIGNVVSNEVTVGK